MNFAPYIPSQIEDISGLGNALASKEPTLASGTTTQFYRGDKTWQTLNYLAVAGLSSVAHSGSYADLSGVPSLAAVALSGAYADLSGKPAASEPVIAAGTTTQFWRGDKSWQTLDKTAVGLSNVDNTSDAAKQTANDARFGRLASNNTWIAGQTFGGILTCKGIALPDNVNAYNIGDATNKIQDIYFKGALYGGNIACGAAALTVYGMRSFSFTTDNVNTVLLAGGFNQDTVLRPYTNAYSVALYGFAGQTVPLLRLDLDSTGTGAQRQRIFGAYPSMPTSTNALRTGRTRLTVSDYTAERDIITMEATGSAPAIGFLGASAITRPTITGSRSSGSALTSLLAALATLGLITDSSTT